MRRMRLSVYWCVRRVCECTRESMYEYGTLLGTWLPGQSPGPIRTWPRIPRRILDFDLLPRRFLVRIHTDTHTHKHTVHTGQDGYYCRRTGAEAKRRRSLWFSSLVGFRFVFFPPPASFYSDIIRGQNYCGTWLVRPVSTTRTVPRKRGEVYRFRQTFLFNFFLDKRAYWFRQHQSYSNR